MYQIFDSFVIFITTIILFFIALITSERNKSTMSSFISLIVFIIIFYIGKGYETHKFLFTTYNILSYFGIGFIVMIIGTVIYGYKNADKTDYEINSSERASTALRFLIFWPITVFNFILSDVIGFCVKIFEKITSGMLKFLFNIGKNIKNKK